MWQATGHDTPSDFDLSTHFFHAVSADVRAEGLARWKDQSDGPFSDPGPLDEWLDVDTRAIAGTDDRFFPVSFQKGVAHDRMGITPETMTGGRIVALSRPAELADRLAG